MLSRPTRTSILQVIKDYKAIIPRKLKMSYRPWMRQKEIDLILAILKGTNPQNCLEWGSGFSSLYFPQYLSQEARWLALEHETTWGNTVKNLNKRKNVEIRVVTPDKNSWQGDGNYEEFKSYIESPVGNKYDLIIIDGRARMECVHKGKSLLSDKGVMILHDANRKKYREVVGSMEHSALFTDHRSGYGGMWIGSKQPLKQVLDVDFYQNVWQSHNKLSRLFSIKTSKQ